MPEVKEILLFHHSHLDVGYTHEQPILWELQQAYIDQAIDLCERTEDTDDCAKFRWTCETTEPVMKWLDRASSERIGKFRRFVEGGQICLTALNMHMTPLCNAEQLARALYPVRRLREAFGVPIRTAISHDVNGLPWTLAQLLLDAGIELFTTGINMHFGGIPFPRPAAFRWQCPDGRRLLTFHGEPYSMFTLGCKVWENDLDEVRQGLDRYLAGLASQNYPHDFVYLSATNVPMLDNTPPDQELASLVQRWNAEERGPQIRFATPETLLERLKAVNESLLPVHAGDWTDYWNFGAASAAVETAVSRGAKLTLQCAELLEAFRRGTSSPQDKDLKAKAWEQVQLYDEHSWGANISVQDPDSPITRTQWLHKAHTAYQAQSLSACLLARELEALAGNPLQSNEPEGILLVNPTQTAQTVELFVPPSYTEPGRHTSANRYRMPTSTFHTDAAGDYRGLVELPPFSWKQIPFARMPVRDAGAASARQDDGPGPDGLCSVESPYYRLTYRPDTGRIAGLYDKLRGWSMIDENSEWSFFQFVHESIDQLRAPQTRETLFRYDAEKIYASRSCWNNDWPARRVGAERLTDCRIEHGGSRTALVLEWEAPGVDRLVQRITLFHHRPAIGLSADMYKRDIRTPESVYFAFPLHLQNWTAVYDTAATFAELDKEQIPGVCRDYQGVDRTVSVYGAVHGVTLACPDAPLVQIGDFNFGRERKSIPRDDRPLLLAWPVNNYWDTNFRASQPGKISVYYELTSFDRFDPVQAVEAGMTAAYPVRMFPAVNCREERSGRFMELEGDGVVPVAVKPAEDGEGLVLRLKNVTNGPVRARIAFPEGFVVGKAVLCDVLEESRGEAAPVLDGKVQLLLRPNGLQTVRVAPANS